jgi:hypothetical protein
MRSLTRLLSALCLLALAVPSAFGHGAGEEMAKSANAFLGSLTAEQKAKATFEFDGAERTHWIFVPAVRLGLPIKEMNPGQRHFAQALLSVSLSQRGHMKVESVMALEYLLFLIEEGKGANKRDAENYFVSIFGKPDAHGTWGFRWEGHHCSQNFTIVDGVLVGSTPSFLGTNPGQVKSDTTHVGDTMPGLVGFELLDQEDALGRELAKSLTADQSKAAFFPGKTPQDVITGNKPKADGIIKHKGVAFSELTADQKKLAGKIIAEYVGRARSDFAINEMAAISKMPEDQLFFGYNGGTEAGQAHYYSIQGPTFLLEFANFQNGANHVHASWRDLKKDFGYSPLAEHAKDHK